MYKDIKVILIGGSPMSGKTTLAMKLAAKYEYACISTDDVGEILGTVINFNPMRGFDYREYYVNKSVQELIIDTYQYHEKLWPSVRHLIEIHSNWSSPIIIEGWALYPELVKEIKRPNIKDIWLVSDDDVLRERLIDNESFYKGASSEELMLNKYLRRSLWHNARVYAELTRLKSNYIRISKDLTQEGLVQKATDILSR